MQPNEIIAYYSRRDIQKAIWESAKDREVAVRVNESFAKRPDTIEMPGDVADWARKGATSFHISEERWVTPLDLKTGMTKKQLDELRNGWDLIIDIDTAFWEYAKQTAYFVVEALRFHDIKYIGTKFSVSGDTPILILNKGKISLLPIVEVISLLKNGAKLKTLSLQNNKLEFSKIYNYLEHSDRLYEVLHENSKMPLKVTGHHSVFILKEGKIMQAKVSELKQGDFLVTFNANKNPIVTPVKYTENHFQFSKKLLKRKIKITKGLMRLIGYYLSEGHVTNIINQVGFSFNKNEKGHIADCTKLLLSVTKRHISIRHPNAGSTQILIHSKEWASFFENLCGKKKNKHIPEFAWNLPKPLFMELLKGYIRGDGYKLGKYHIAIKSVAHKLITELLWLCKLNGISCSLSCEQNKPHKLPQGNIFKGSFVYILNIPKSELNLQEFFRGRNKFSPFPRDRTFPVDGLKRVYLQIKPKFFNYHRLEQVTLRKKRANAERIWNVIKWFKRFNSNEFDAHSKEIIANYELLLDSDVGILQVKSITKKSSAKVYDISVKGTEAFFGNYYPLLLHNSGNKGFHIAVPFEAFPDEVNGIKTKDLFPESLRVIAAYLQNMIKGHLSEAILSKEHISQIAEKAGKRIDELILDGSFDPFKIVDIDTVLISSRHMFRAPYSLHEKAGLVSLPIKQDEILTFEKEKAKPFAVKPVLKFIDREAAKQNEASSLIIQAFDWDKKAKRDGRAEDKLNLAAERKKSSGIEDEKIVVKEECFPPCMKKILSSKLDDGKKRALFLLLKFLIHCGWSWEDIEKKLYEWNNNHSEPLRENYVLEQINWHKKQKIIVLPPNCDKVEYYKELQFCSPLPLCSKIRNPVNFAKINAKRWASIEANQQREKEKDERRAKRAKRAPRSPKKSE
ncbi:MAG: hypothetical protein KJ955_08105 [Nanoarchaeota archaeon]|nr:hypothetical protein [Nanoarchaeota archaeon]